MNTLYTRTTCIPDFAHRESFVDTIGCTREELTRLVIIARVMHSWDAPCDLFVATLREYTLIGAVNGDYATPHLADYTEWVDLFREASRWVDDNYLELRDTYGDHDIPVTFSDDSESDPPANE